MPLAGKDECITDLFQVDGLDRVIGVLGDDREQIRQQLALTGVELLVAIGRDRNCAVLRAGAVETDADVGVRQPRPRGALAPATGSLFLARRR